MHEAGAHAGSAPHANHRTGSGCVRRPQIVVLSLEHEVYRPDLAKRVDARANQGRAKTTAGLKFHHAVGQPVHPSGDFALACPEPAARHCSDEPAVTLALELVSHLHDIFRVFPRDRVWHPCQKLSGDLHGGRGKQHINKAARLGNCSRAANVNGGLHRNCGRALAPICRDRDHVVAAHDHFGVKPRSRPNAHTALEQLLKGVTTRGPSARGVHARVAHEDVPASQFEASHIRDAGDGRPHTAALR